MVRNETMFLLLAQISFYSGFLSCLIILGIHAEKGYPMQGAYQPGKLRILREFSKCLKAREFSQKLVLDRDIEFFFL